MMSAFLPASSDPISWSRLSARAASIVTMRSALPGGRTAISPFKIRWVNIVRDGSFQRSREKYGAEPSVAMATFAPASSNSTTGQAP